MLTNLVVNAAQAMRNEGVVAIDVTGAPNGKWVRISVRDHGPGIPEEVAKRIFEPLVTTKRTGTGLGLAIVQRIALDNGGSVSFETAPGRGTTFHVDLPVGSPHEATIAAEAEAGESRPDRPDGGNRAPSARRLSSERLLRLARRSRGDEPLWSVVHPECRFRTPPKRK